MTVLVAAENRHHAEHHARQEGLMPDWRYLSDSFDLRGRRGVSVVICASFWNRRDSAHLAGVMRQAEVVHLELAHNKDARCGPVAP